MSRSTIIRNLPTVLMFGLFALYIIILVVVGFLPIAGPCPA